MLKDDQKIFFGCANGLSGYPYKRTIEDPNEAIIKTPSSVLYVSKVKMPMVKVEKRPAMIALTKFSFVI